MCGWGFKIEDVPELVQANMRTDGKARYYMVQSVHKGNGANEKELLEQIKKPLAIIIGEQGPLINNNYIAHGVHYKNLIALHF